MATPCFANLNTSCHLDLHKASRIAHISCRCQMLNRPDAPKSGPLVGVKSLNPHEMAVLMLNGRNALPSYSEHIWLK